MEHKKCLKPPTGICCVISQVGQLCSIYSKKTHPDEFLPQTIQSGMCFFAYNALYLEPQVLGVLYDIYCCLYIIYNMRYPLVN
jgi:hypothetical protein